MTAEKEIAHLINQLYTVETLMKVFHRDPHSYCGVTLYDCEAHTLEKIAENEGLSQAQLTRMTFRTKGATSVMVDELLQKGLGYRARPAQDRRQCLLRLTEKGREVDRQHQERDLRHARLVAEQAGLTGEELAQANQVLDRLVEFYSTLEPSE